MKDEQLLAEVEDVILTLPAKATLRHDLPENFSWFGRASAVLRTWSPSHAARFQVYMQSFSGGMHVGNEFFGMMAILNEARHSLRLKTSGPLAVAFDNGKVFDYFDELRKKIELATQDLFFVDPYIDASFVADYLPHVKSGVSIRILSREKISTLLPAARAFANQTNATIEIRSALGFHDRYVFIDNTICFHSGASFKDGAKKAPTVINEITDAAGPMIATYSGIWNSAKPELF